MKFCTDSPRAAMTLSILAVLVCGFIWWRYLADPTGPHTKWGYDLGNGELFRVAITAVSPYAASTGPENGVDALGVRDLNGVSSAFAVRKYSPEAAALVRRMIEPEGVLDNPRAMMDTINQGKLIRRITDTEWVSEISPAGVAIIREMGTEPVAHSR